MNEAKKRYLDSVKLLCPKLTSNELQYLESGLTIPEFNPKHF